MNGQRPHFTPSTDARILQNVLERELVKGGKDFVAYETLTAAIGGRDVQGKARHLLKTAQRHVEADHKLLIRCRTGEGLELTEDRPGLLRDSRKRAGRSLRRQQKRVLASMDGKELSAAEQASVATELTLAGAMQLFTKPKSEKVIAGRVAAAQGQELPTRETLRLFANGSTGTQKSEPPTTDHRRLTTDH